MSFQKKWILSLAVFFLANPVIAFNKQNRKKQSSVTGCLVDDQKNCAHQLKEYQDRIVSNNSRIQALGSEIEGKNSEVKTLQGQRNAMSSDSKKINIKLKEETKKRRAVQKSRQKSLGELRKMSSQGASQSQCLELQRMIQTMGDQIVTMRNNIDNMQYTYKNNMRKIKRVKHRIMMLEHEAKSLGDERFRLTKDNKHLQGEIDALNKKMRCNQVEIQAKAVEEPAVSLTDI